MRTLLIVAVIASLSGCAPLSTRPKSEAQVESLQQMLDRQEMEFRLKKLLKEEHEQRAPHKR